MTGWQQYSDIIIQFTLYPSSEMAVLRRPVSQRRQARRRDSIKVRGPASKSSKYSTFKRINTSRGTNPQNMVVHRGIGLPDKFRTRLVWNQAIALTGFSSAITQVYSVRMNGPFDPQAALGGTQLSIMTCLLACIVRTLSRALRLVLHSVLRLLALLAMGLMSLVLSVADLQEL